MDEIQKLKLEYKDRNQGDVSYTELPYSSADRDNWRVDDGVVVCDGVCKAGGQCSEEKVKSVGKSIVGAKINIE